MIDETCCLAAAFSSPIASICHCSQSFCICFLVGHCWGGGGCGAAREAGVDGGGVGKGECPADVPLLPAPVVACVDCCTCVYNTTLLHTTFISNQSGISTWWNSWKQAPLIGAECPLLVVAATLSSDCSDTYKYTFWSLKDLATKSITCYIITHNNCLHFSRIHYSYCNQIKYLFEICNRKTKTGVKIIWLGMVFYRLVYRMVCTIQIPLCNFKNFENYR